MIVIYRHRQNRRYWLLFQDYCHIRRVHRLKKEIAHQIENCHHLY